MGVERELEATRVVQGDDEGDGTDEEGTEPEKADTIISDEDDDLDGPDSDELEDDPDGDEEEREGAGDGRTSGEMLEGEDTIHVEGEDDEDLEEV